MYYVTAVKRSVKQQLAFLNANEIEVDENTALLNVDYYVQNESYNLFNFVRYWDTLLEMFYPRFEHLLQMNIQSIRDCEPQRLGHIDVRPHYVCEADI